MSDILGIEKKRNLRDLGGYKTQNGKHVKKGYFFRSSRLMDFDQNEIEILNSLHIQKIYDLRSKEEVEHAPDPELLGAEYIHLSAAIPVRSFPAEQWNKIGTLPATISSNILLYA